MNKLEKEWKECLESSKIIGELEPSALLDPFSTEWDLFLPDAKLDFASLMVIECAGYVFLADNWILAAAEKDQSIFWKAVFAAVLLLEYGATDKWEKSKEVLKERFSLLERSADGRTRTAINSHVKAMWPDPSMGTRHIFETTSHEGMTDYEIRMNVISEYLDKGGDVWKLVLVHYRDLDERDNFVEKELLDSIWALACMF